MSPIPRSENGEIVCIATDESYFILKYNAESVVKARETKEDITEDGVETAFDVSSCFLNATKNKKSKRLQGSNRSIVCC